MCRQALALVSLVLLLAAGCMSVESGADNQQGSPGNQGCPGCNGRAVPPPQVQSLQDAYGRPPEMIAPYSSNPPPNNWTAQQMLRQSRPLQDLQFNGGSSLAQLNQATYQSGMARTGFAPPMTPVPPGNGWISPVGMPPVPSMSPGKGVMQAGGTNPGPGGMNPYAGGGVQQAQYSPYPPRGYPPSSAYPAAGNYPYYNPYPPAYNPYYPGYYPNSANMNGYPPIQRTQYSPGAQGIFTPPTGPYNPGSGSAFSGPGGMPLGAGAATNSCARTQVRFVRPVGMKVHWYTMGPDCRPMYSSALHVPGSYNFPQGAIYRLKLTNIDSRPELDVYPTMEVMAGNSKTEAFLSHSAVPLEFTSEDFKQIVEGNYVVKVIYLPDPQFQDVAGTGTDEILSTRLEPGVDPIQAARQRGTVLLVIRMGNVQQELDNTPPLYAPGRSASGAPPGMTFCPPGYGPGAGGPQYGNPNMGGGGFGPGFGLGGLSPGGPPTTMQRQLIQIPYFYPPQGSAGGNANCPPGVFPGRPCPPGMCPPGMQPGYGYPNVPGASMVPSPAIPPPATSQGNPPRLLPPATSTSLPTPAIPPPAAAGSDMPSSLPSPDPHESKSSPIGASPGQDKQPSPAPAASGLSGPPASELTPDVPKVLPETPSPSAGSLAEPPPGSTGTSNPPVTVDGPNGVMRGPPPETDTPPTTTPPANDKPGTSSESAQPMGVPDSKTPETPAVLPQVLPDVPSVPQTLQPTPGLSDVVPPAKTSSLSETPKQPAKTPMNPDAIPAFPDSPAPILPAPAPVGLPSVPPVGPLTVPNVNSATVDEPPPTSPAPMTAPGESAPQKTEPPLATPVPSAVPMTTSGEPPLTSPPATPVEPPLALPAPPPG